MPRWGGEQVPAVGEGSGCGARGGGHALDGRGVCGEDSDERAAGLVNAARGPPVARATTMQTLERQDPNDQPTCHSGVWVGQWGGWYALYTYVCWGWAMGWAVAAAPPLLSNPGFEGGAAQVWSSSMDQRVAKLRSAVDALRTQMAALAAQQSARQTRATKKQARSRQAQLPDEVARLEARIVTVEQHRAVRSSRWGSELPYSLLGEVFNTLGWGGPECAAMRLVSAGWCSAHDSMCPRLRIRSWAAAGCPGWAVDTLNLLERVTTVDLRQAGGCVYRATGGMFTNLSLLQSLPSLTSLELGLDDVLSEVEAKALGGLTKLTSLTLVRNLEDNFAPEVMGYVGECDCDDCMADASQRLYESRHQLRVCAGMDHWAKALSPLTALTHLDLSKCQNVTANTLRPLPKLTALTSLELGDGVVVLGGVFTNYSLDDEAMHAVASVSSLTTLTLKECREVTHKGLAKLGRLSALTSLHLTHCYVSVSAMQALQAAIPLADIVVVT